MPSDTDQASDGALAGLGRAFAGALIFALPMLMTMEMWELGFTMGRGRLALLLLISLPLLVGLSHRAGFEATFDWRDDLRDAGVALGIAVVGSAALLALLGVLDATVSLDEALGKVAVQAVPASFGALLGRSQLGGESLEETPQALQGYGGEFVVMAIGALFLGLNLAPTQEMLVLSFFMTPLHAIALLAVTIALMHAFVYSVGFRGGGTDDSDRPPGNDFLRFTVSGYVLALAISLYALWTFGRTDDLGSMQIAMTTLVLAFPVGIGAAAARLIL